MLVVLLEWNRNDFLTCIICPQIALYATLLFGNRKRSLRETYRCSRFVFVNIQDQRLDNDSFRSCRLLMVHDIILHCIVLSTRNLYVTIKADLIMRSDEKISKWCISSLHWAFSSSLHFLISKYFGKQQGKVLSIQALVLLDIIWLVIWLCPSYCTPCCGKCPNWISLWKSLSSLL